MPNPAPIFDTQHCLLANGYQLAYYQVGHGPNTILAIHGLACDKYIWNYNTPTLSQYYKVICIDLPGYGQSPAITQKPTLHEFCQIMALFITTMKLPQIILMGHSMGGQISIMFTHLYPQLVQKLILMAPAGIETFTTAEKEMTKASLTISSMIYKQPTQLVNWLKDGFAKSSPHNAEFIQILSQKITDKMNTPFSTLLTSHITAMLDEPVFAYLSQINIPVLLCYGAKDKLIPNKLFHRYTTSYLGQNAQQIIPNCQLHILNNCGHFLQWEDYQNCNNFIKNFINQS